MTILKTLLNAGLVPNDARILDEKFPNERDGEFLSGLEQVSRAVATGDISTVIPECDPWKTIYTKMQFSSSDPGQAFVAAVGDLDSTIQIAVAGAVTMRMQEIQKTAQLVHKGKKRKSAEYITLLSQLGYQFQLNLCTHDIEVNHMPITDELSKQIRGRLRDSDVWEVDIVEDAYGAKAHDNRYHPIKDYLQNLKYEGGHAVDDLCSCFSDEYGVINTWLKRWLIGAVARVMAKEQNRVLVFDSPQGMGKSNFCKWLVSPMHEYGYEGPIMPEEKDCRLRLLSVWLWEVSEFGSTVRKSDRERLKAFISTQTVRERKPYGRYDIQGPAITSFIGTVNNESGILSDPTGNRRFMVTKLTGIDWNYTTIDIDQVWAQAYDLYMTGEPWKLQPNEITVAAEINQDYEIIDIVEETIKKIFNVDPADVQSWMTTEEILTVLKDPARGNLKAGTEVDTRRVAGALTRMGLDKPKSKKLGRSVLRGYHGIRLRP